MRMLRCHPALQQRLRPQIDSAPYPRRRWTTKLPSEVPNQPLVSGFGRRTPVTVLRNRIQITRSACLLSGRTGRLQPRRVVEVKELCHAFLRGIALGQRGQAEPRFNQFHNSRGVHYRMGDVMLPRIR